MGAKAGASAEGARTGMTDGALLREAFSSHAGIEFDTRGDAFF